MTDTSPLSAFWRRLDVPGHDACRVRQAGAGWLLDGVAVFDDSGKTGNGSALRYQVACDTLWHARGARVSGWFRSRDVDWRIDRHGTDGWTLNGVHMCDADGCVDIDLSFTPATNFPALQRLGLGVGHTAEAPAAWLNVEDGEFRKLTQTYERRSEWQVWYSSPTTRYSAMLELGVDGFVAEYPGLWMAESHRDHRPNG